MPNVTGDRVVWAVMACGAIVLIAEPPTVALLRRLAVLAVRLILLGVPVEAVIGPVALYLADVAWTRSGGSDAASDGWRDTARMSTSAGATRAGLVGEA
jgi:hypothetical protein